MSAQLKVIFLFIFTILVASCSTGTKVVNSDKIKPGMTKIDVEWVLASRAIIHQAALPAGYREYFSDSKKEILSDERKQVYYVYTLVCCMVHTDTA